MTEQQRQNIEAVKGTEVKVWNEKQGCWSRKTARITDYCSPLVWELDRKIYGTRYWSDRDVRTLDDRWIHELV